MFLLMSLDLVIHGQSLSSVDDRCWQQNKAHSHLEHNPSARGHSTILLYLNAPNLAIWHVEAIHFLYSSRFGSELAPACRIGLVLVAVSRTSRLEALELWAMAFITAPSAV